MNKTEHANVSLQPGHYVRIEASAGELEAIEDFFRHMRAECGLAFIVIQHLSPDYKSLMKELLSKKTEMRVHRAEDGMEVLANNVYLIPPKTDRRGGRQGAFPREHRRPQMPPEENRILHQFLDVLTEDYITLAVVVNERMEIQHTIGDSEGFFKVPSGRAVYDITKMAARDLAIPLATGIQKVFRTGEEIKYSNLRLRFQQDHRSIHMRILAFPERKNIEPLVAVVFEELKNASTSGSEVEAVYDLGEEARQRIRDLEQELQFARENLQATIEELEIRKYSPEVTRIFRIMDKDIGRPITHISHSLLDFDTVEVIRSVQKSSQPREEEVRVEDGTWYLARILPYHIGPVTFSGVVLTFVDITAFKKARKQLDSSLRTSRDIISFMPSGLFLYVLDREGRLVLESANPEAERLTGIITTS